jgi:hypothetical protein
MPQGFGRTVYDDYIEHRPGAVDRLVEYLNSLGITAVTEYPEALEFPSQEEPAQSPLDATENDLPAGSAVPGASGFGEQPSPAVASFIHEETEIEMEQNFYLSCGISGCGLASSLEETVLNGVTDDSELFKRLNFLYNEKRRRTLPFWSLRKLSGIHFAKVRSG